MESLMAIISSAKTSSVITAPARPKRATLNAVAAADQTVVQPNSPVRVAPGAVAEFRDRRRRRRVDVPSMYSSAVVRVLTQQSGPIDGHIINLAENGIAVELDHKIPVGHAVTIEFSLTGLGRIRNDEWPTFAVAAEVVRLDNLDDFPGGPYHTAMRFVRIPTMVQAQIARYIVSHA